MRQRGMSWDPDAGPTMPSRAAYAELLRAVEQSHFSGIDLDRTAADLVAYCAGASYCDGGIGSWSRAAAHLARQVRKSTEQHPLRWARLSTWAHQQLRALTFPPGDHGRSLLEAIVEAGHSVTRDVPRQGDSLTRYAARLADMEPAATGHA